MREALEYEIENEEEADGVEVAFESGHELGQVISGT